ncbi:MAG: nucleotidyltransferase domain-containing protein [Candidatus Bathyarchaeota archaeon]
MKDKRTKILRNKVAQEAALLLYTSQEKEYKQAKKRASLNLGARVFPSNFEVAEELDRLSKEREGAKREELLLRMRIEAKEIMEHLKVFNPSLVGSVWRGTVHQNSDIDIQTFSQDNQEIIEKLQKNKYKINGSEWRAITKQGRKESSFHINIILPSNDNVEISVRSLDRLGELEICEIYGDNKTGLNLNQLERILKENPLQKFLPNRKIC